jgi:hypothetical protein
MGKAQQGEDEEQQARPCHGGDSGWIGKKNKKKKVEEQKCSFHPKGVNVCSFSK